MDNPFQSKLVLGSAQFGMHYGVANDTGIPSLNSISTILELAKNAGINTIDTAMNYGNCEERLGIVGIKDWRLVTKIPAIPADALNLNEWVLSLVLNSVKLTGVVPYAILVHKTSDLLGVHGDKIYSGLNALRLVYNDLKIGVSVYTPQEAETIAARYQIDLMQFPFNLLDRRFLISGTISRLKSLGIELHSRSTFLQGLLLMPNYLRPLYFSQWNEIWNIFDNYINDANESALEICLRFALQQQGIDGVIVAAESEIQICQILSAVKIGAKNSIDIDIFSNDINLINPSKWPIIA